MTSSTDPNPEIEAMWREVLVHGHSHKLGFLPSSPRCLACKVPFGGIGGKVSSLFGLHPSRKNPNVCNLCDDVLPKGGAEIDIAVFFADVRGSTGLAERLGPSAFAALLNRFYDAASKAILASVGFIDKMVGDEVMALYVPNTSPEYHRNAVRAARDLMRAVGYGGPGEPWLPLGIGVHSGLAYVGRVGTGEVHDVTALGDTVNTAARLQGEASAGEIILSEEIYKDVVDLYPNLEQRVLTLRGKEASFPARVLKLGEYRA